MADTNKMPGYVYKWQDGKLLPVKIPGAASTPLSSALDSEAENVAATSKAVKLVNDKAEGKVGKAGDTMTGMLNINLSGTSHEIIKTTLSGVNVVSREGLSSDQIFNGFWIRDANGKQFSIFGSSVTQDRVVSYLTAENYKTSGESYGQASVGAAVTSAGVKYGYAPAPRELAYANDIDTLRASVNRHPLKVTDIQVHVGGANASDTADLFSGRGLSADKPFATLLAAINFINHNYLVANRAMFILHSDITITDRQRILVKNMGMCAVCSDDTKRTITLEGSAAYLDMWGGCFAMWDVNVQLNGARNFIRSNSVYGFATVYLGNQFDTASHAVNLNGTVTVATIEAPGGSVYLHDELTGSVTGKRYACTNGGRIITNGRGVNAIPGTIAGTCDESSIYA